MDFGIPLSLFGKSMKEERLFIFRNVVSFFEFGEEKFLEIMTFIIKDKNIFYYF
jgi:hypothetical protein